MSTKRFRVAFSFAGEKCDFVSQVAGLLATEFGEQKVLYDKFHEAEFAGRDLGTYLPELYHKESDLVVIVLSPACDAKTWTGLEWTAIHDLLSHRQDDEVMLCRFGQATVTGLDSTAGLVELDGKAPEEIRSLILERLALIDQKCEMTKQRNAASTDRPAHTSPPNNLPPLQPFFGREHELAQIREALDHKSLTWGALLHGPVGIGKTSLAIRAAYDCPPGQFQRIIFLSVKDREMDENGARSSTGFLFTGLQEVFDVLARKLKIPDFEAVPEDQRVPILLNALRPAQVLLILDNFESLPKPDRHELFAFVKLLPPGCKAILTGHPRQGATYAEILLEPLRPPAALALLDELARHHPLLAQTSADERMALHHWTGGHPLLLRWMALHLGRGRCHTFPHAIQFLRSCPPGHDPLEFVFGDLVGEFTPDELRVLCILTYFPRPARVEHIAALAGGSEPPSRRRREEAHSFSVPGSQSLLPSAAMLKAVKTALPNLAQLSLVLPDHWETAFTLRPRLAEFLWRQRPVQVAEVGIRLERRAFALIAEGEFHKRDRHMVIEANWTTVAPALPLFVAGSYLRLQEVCTALHEFLQQTGRWDEWLALEQQAEARALAAGDPLSAAKRARMAGTVHLLRREASAVLASASRARTHFQQAQASVHELASAWRLEIAGHKLNQDYPAAIAACRELLEMDRHSDAGPMFQISALNDLARTEQEAGGLAAAERDYREAMRLARARGYPENVATCTSHLAALMLVRGDFPSAEALARQALLAAEAAAHKTQIATNCHYLAQALWRQGRKEEALQYAQRAVEIYTKLGSLDLPAAQATLAELEQAQ